MIRKIRVFSFLTFVGLLISWGLRDVAASEEKQQTYISSLAWSPDGSKVAIGYATPYCDSDPQFYIIHILDPVTRNVIQNLTGSTCSITSLDWSPDGTKVAASSLDDWGLRVWDAQTGQLVSTIQVGGQGVCSVKWKPDGFQLAAAGCSNGTALIDPNTGKGIGSPPIGGTSLAWSPDGSKLVSGSGYEGAVRVADMNADQQIMYLEGHTAGISNVSWSPDGTLLVSAGGIDDPTIRIWDAESGENTLILEEHTGAIRGVAWSPDSTRLVSASSDGTVRIWDLTIGQLLETFSNTYPIYAVDWSPDGTQLAYGGSSPHGQEAQVKFVDVSDDFLTLTPNDAEATPES
ncbi:MAG: WD40 repeat domain-containing protein [Chloroflexota bacterium]